MADSSGSCYEAVLDTSFLLFIVERRADLVGVLLGSQLPVCRVLIPLSVLSELRSLASSGKSSRAVKAATALMLVEQVLRNYRELVAVLEDEPPGETVDDRVIAAAAQESRVLITADKEMRRKARRRGVKAYLLAKASLRLL